MSNWFKISEYVSDMKRKRLTNGKLLDDFISRNNIVRVAGLIYGGRINRLLENGTFSSFYLGYNKDDSILRSNMLDHAAVFKTSNKQVLITGQPYYDKAFILNESMLTHGDLSKLINDTVERGLRIRLYDAPYYYDGKSITLIIITLTDVPIYWDGLFYDSKQEEETNSNETN